MDNIFSNVSHGEKSLELYNKLTEAEWLESYDTHEKLTAFIAYCAKIIHESNNKITAFECLDHISLLAHITANLEKETNALQKSWTEGIN